MRHAPTLASRRAQRGAALVEYTIIAVLGIIVLIAEPNIILELVEALRKAYSSFVYALSLGWI